ncbi:MAG TPA: hypothetical protein VE093_38090 [Polyangiaceae bacterium]|jgi:hypothetical protein|nr:hypothetical protein [Actinomycetota bacterium]HZF54539.1 hypothetical protein [Polyangiaceae bacterium]
MPELAAPAARDLVLLPLAEKNRPAVVLRVLEDRVVVLIYGTGTLREMPRIEVRPETRDGKALGFYKPTYFYVSGVRAARAEILIRTGRRCPPELFLKLRALAEQTPGDG